MQKALQSYVHNTFEWNYEKIICNRFISHLATRIKEVCIILELKNEI